MRTNRSNRSARPTRSTRPARPTRAIALSAASAAGVAALAVGGYASAAEPHAAAPRTVSTMSATTSSSTVEASPVRVEHQAGKVMEGTADGVMVTVYENSMYGSSIQVVLGDPDEENFGYVEQAGPFVHDGVLDVTIDVKGTPVRLHGTVTETGRPEKIRESYQDAGQQIVDKGTHTQLATDVDVTIRGTSAPVSFAPAFAYDLESRKVTLYGR